MLVITATWMLRLEDHEFKASLSETLPQKKEKKNE
jgi:hypothetical protein